MKKIKLITILLATIFFCSGCLLEIKEQNVTVQKRNNESGIYEDFKKITDKKQVQQAIEIVENADWQIEKEEMNGNADYQFQFPFKHGSEGKEASYLLWINSDDENLEIVTDSNKHVKLSRNDSADLHSILIGKEFIK